MSANKIHVHVAANGKSARIHQPLTDAELTVSGAPHDVLAIARACRRPDVMLALEEEFAQRGAPREPFVSDPADLPGVA